MEKRTLAAGVCIALVAVAALARTPTRAPIPVSVILEKDGAKCKDIVEPENVVLGKKNHDKVLWEFENVCGRDVKLLFVGEQHTPLQDKKPLTKCKIPPNTPFAIGDELLVPNGALVYVRCEVDDSACEAHYKYHFTSDSLEESRSHELDLGISP